MPVLSIGSALFYFVSARLHFFVFGSAENMSSRNYPKVNPIISIPIAPLIIEEIVNLPFFPPTMLSVYKDHHGGRGVFVQLLSNTSIRSRKRFPACHSEGATGNGLMFEKKYFPLRGLKPRRPKNLSSRSWTDHPI